MSAIETLERQREALKGEITRNLDLLVGSVGRSPSMSGSSLTSKVAGKTVTLYVRKGLLRRVRAMTARHKKVKALIQRLSKVNWQLLERERD